MSAHNPSTNRRPDHGVPHPDHLPENGRLSTRILLDGSSKPTCEACGKAIEINCRHKCLTVFDDTATAREFAFCGEACLPAREQ